MGSPAVTTCAPTPSPVPVAPAPGLAPEHRAAIAAARVRGGKVRRAAVVAAVSGWTLAVFAGLSLLVGVFSLSSFVVGVALAVVAWTELKGARRMRGLDPGAAKHLAWNQLALAAVIVAYAAWGLYTSVFGPGPYAAQLAAGGPVAETLAPIDRLQRVVAAATYSAVIAIGFIVPALTAVYYATRRPHVESFLRETPDWIVESMRI